MGTPRKLTQEQERQVALTYFCGVDIGCLIQNYAVSDATIRSNIIGKRSKEWDDPLVELYREAGVRGREHNSAHLFLSFQGNAPKIEPSRLTDPWKDRPVYDTVDHYIYTPRIEEIIQRTALREYTDSQSPYDKFLQTLVGGRQGEEYHMVRGLFIDALKEAYQTYQSSNALFSLDQVSKKVRETIVDKIKNGGLAWSKLKKQVVHTALNTISDRERETLGMRCGLDGYGGPKGLEEVGATTGVSKERVRQIEAKALRKLRHPSRYNNLIALTGLTTDADLEAHLEKVRYQQERTRWKTELYPEIEREILGRTTVPSDVIHRSIDELELSIRSYHCLKNSDIKTVGELCEKTEVDLLRTKKFGRKSLREIKEVLAEMGLKLGMTTSQEDKTLC